MRRIIVVWFLLLLALPLVACSDSTGPGGELAGTWVGIAYTTQDTAIAQLVLARQDRALTGTGAVDGVPFSLTGTATGARFTGLLKLQGEQFSRSISGEVRGDQLTATVMNAGTPNHFDLHRQ